MSGLSRHKAMIGQQIAGGVTAPTTTGAENCGDEKRKGGDLSELPLQLLLDARVARKTKLKSFRDIFPQVTIAHTDFDSADCLRAPHKPCCSSNRE